MNIEGTPRAYALLDFTVFRPARSIEKKHQDRAPIRKRASVPEFTGKKFSQTAFDRLFIGAHQLVAGFAGVHVTVPLLTYVQLYW
ncbi:hypothetical protein [Nocardia fusca]|uniref:hypothetical protein n=1 Tax=Nocardia fusca TaxID=941183 RepID=UPI0012F47D9A|nr:hypothetical protein [Nocardia fusca]